MKKLANLSSILIMLLLFNLPFAKAQDVIIQGFYWNTHPGDLSDTMNGGIWWDSITAVAPKLGAAGFQTIWAPPPQKGFAGKFDMGYGPYDYYDMGQFDSKGTIRTRHGSAAQLEAMITALHNNGVDVMADIVLNHRGGGDVEVPREVGGGTGFLEFNPPSGRFFGNAGDFHPNNFHADQDPPFHDPLFFEDICYFNNATTIPPTDAAGNASNWYFGSPDLIGRAGVELISWGRFLMDSVGFDEVRLDAVKHIEPDFLAKFIVEVQDGDQPFALGEFFDYDIGALEAYRNSVINSTNSGTKNANMSLFDFPLRGSLKAILNDASGGQDLYNGLGGAGLVWSTGMTGFDVVTWLDTHDTDRTGFVEDNEGCQIPFGNSCLRFETLDDHDPIFTDKEDMGYPVLLASEGRPIVFWKDYFWYGMEDDINWLMPLRSMTATGPSQHIQTLNGFWPQDGAFDGDNNGGNMFAMIREGFSGGVDDGMVLGLNDHPSKTNGVYVNTPFTNIHLKDYSDGIMFESSEAFGDGRALIKAQARDYSWYAPTGLYPTGAGKSSSHFTMNATPGGCPHFVAMAASNTANYLINGNPIEVGDEVAAINSSGQVVGIGRIGQGYQWDGVHDMIIEVLGAPSGNGMLDGETINIVVYDASTGTEEQIATLTYASSGSVFNFSPDRPNSPNRNGNFSTFALNANAEGSFTCNGISFISGFGVESCAITSVELGMQSACDIATNTYSQEVIISFDNAPDSGILIVNGISAPLEVSPQVVIVEGNADGQPVDISVSIPETSCELQVPAAFVAPEACNISCNASSASAGDYDDGWSSGDNDGSGFGPWILSTQFNNPGNGGHFVFTSVDNGDGDSNGDSDIDILGEAWGMYANSGDVSNAVRPFAAPLEVDATFSFGFDNGWIDNGGTVGFGIQNAGGQNLLEFFFAGGTPTYTLIDGSGANGTTIGFTDEGMKIEFSLLSASSYALRVTTLGDGTTYDFTGNLIANGDQSPGQIRFFNANAGFDAPRNLFVNALEICTPVLPPCELQLISTSTTCPEDAGGSALFEVAYGIAQYEVSVNDSVVLITNDSVFSVENLPAGSFIVKVADSKGCEATQEVVIIAEDNEAPVITCPTDQIFSADVNCEAIVMWDAPVVSDNCTITSISSNINPGDTLPVGDYTVVYQVIDVSGNASNCSFEISVQDNEAPVIDAGLPTIYSWGNYSFYHVESDGYDNCDSLVEVKSAIEVPTLESPQVLFNRHRWLNIVKYEPQKNRVRIISDDPEALWQAIQSNEGAQVSDGQFLIQKVSSLKEKYTYVFRSNGTLFGTSSPEALAMISKATDDNGNSNVVITEPGTSTSGGRIETQQVQFEEEIEQFDLEENIFEEFDVYPNPANSHFFIVRPELLGETFTVTIYDQAGAALYQEDVNTEGINIHKVDLVNLKLKKGLYMLQLNGVDGDFSDRLIIK